jgi:hypothetical protein
MRAVFALSFLAAQLALIVYARFDSARYFTWAPHDAQNEYEIRASVDGVALDSAALQARYQLEPIGVDPRAIEHVLRTVRQYHETYGAHERSEVRVDYRTNGGPPQQWSWSSP